MTCNHQTQKKTYQPFEGRVLCWGTKRPGGGLVGGDGLIEGLRGGCMWQHLPKSPPQSPFSGRPASFLAHSPHHPCPRVSPVSELRRNQTPSGKSPEDVGDPIPPDGPEAMVPLGAWNFPSVPWPLRRGEGSGPVVTRSSLWSHKQGRVRLTVCLSDHLSGKCLPSFLRGLGAAVPHATSSRR